MGPTRELKLAGSGHDHAAPVALVWDPSLAAYDFGEGHPLGPVRVELTYELIRALGFLDAPHVREVRPREISDEELLRLHRRDFVEAVQRVSADPSTTVDWSFGLGTSDCPTFTGMHAASRAVCSASVEAARLVWEGDAVHAFNPAGGLHHAMPDRAAGFCIYNDPAVAIDWLLEHGAERVAYLDVDVHHGDGVERMFADDPRVLTISLHESGHHLFPGTGFPDDIGGPQALGSAANVPFHPGTTGEIWMRAFEAIVEPLLTAFQPDVLVSQLGCDTHATDPLAHLMLTVEDFAAITRRIHRAAHEVAGGRWVALGGGGYQWVQVVPRAWTMAFAELAGLEVPADVPQGWRDLATLRTGETAPTTFSDGVVRVSPSVEGVASTEAEQAIVAVRSLVLPHHGLR